MIKGEFLVGIDGLKETGMIRDKVFIEEQKVDPIIEHDLYDYFAHHLIIKDNDIPVATGRLIIQDNNLLIGRIAVIKEKRGNRLGDLVVRMLVDRGFKYGEDTIFVHAQTNSQVFYEKVGFKVFGETYIEAEIEHISMILSKKDFTDSGCKNCKKC